MTGVDTRFLNPVTGDKCPAVWRDKAGVMHRAVGSYVHRRIRLMWTGCGKKDIPADGAWLQTPEDAVTCPDCREQWAQCIRCDEVMKSGDCAEGCRDPQCPMHTATD